MPIAIALFGVLFEYSGLDLLLAEQFFDWESMTWPWQLRSLTKLWLHDYVQKLLLVIGLAILAAQVASLV